MKELRFSTMGDDWEQTNANTFVSPLAAECQKEGPQRRYFTFGDLNLPAHFGFPPARE